MIFAQRVVGFARQTDIFLTHRNVGAAHGVARINAIHQARIIGRDADRQRSGMAHDGVPFVIGQLEDTFKLRHRLNPVANLPAPIRPFGGCGVGEKPLFEGAALIAQRKTLDYKAGLRKRNGRRSRGCRLLRHALCVERAGI